MTPSELKYRVESRGTAPHFFTRKTMQFFGDTMRNYGARATVVTVRHNMAGGHIQHVCASEVQVWELYRKNPVKYGLKKSHYFAKDDFRLVHPVEEGKP